ncbi:aminoacyl-tRNA hydrolase [Actinocatenispora rupis]|uniref:Peptidyl-tRNA hydrolase n=1 Tax=Actinocatenispora rupis TaxID=519421 RepID=A0A8J3J1K7_9ACTN|nr:aminoacyl-tRNA hydrolase [Actinocatenispora rupis]GID10322.1 peptidyl-tRNA hydrolase [Actinocatenispora rupis]
MAGPYLIVGLGNPGPEYAAHRHNVGFMVADLLAARLGAGFKRHGRARAQVAEGWLGGPGGTKLVLAKPQSFMNLAGGPVAGLAGFFSVGVDRIVVVHDELDLPYGTLKLKRGGGEGGHNGLRSISRSLASKEYTRVRFGIGRPPGRQDPADFVLKPFSSVERKELDVLLETAADATEAVVQHGLEWAQNAFHAA